MVERYDYAYRVWYCKLDNKPCEYDARCEDCYWARVQREAEDLSREEYQDSLEPSTKEEMKQ